MAEVETSASAEAFHVLAAEDAAIVTVLLLRCFLWRGLIVAKHLRNSTYLVKVIFPAAEVKALLFLIHVFLLDIFPQVLRG